MTAIENIYFDAGGFYAMNQHVGSVQELHRQSIVPKKIYGCSAGGGSGLACWLILNGYMSIERIQSITYQIFDNKRPISNDLTHIYCEIVDETVPYWPTNLAAQISGKLYVGISTRRGFKWIHHYKTNAELYHAVLMSGTIPNLTSYSSKFNGEVCLDGCIDFKHENLPDNTLMLHCDVEFPMNLTIPPAFIRPLFVELGRRNVIDRKQPDGKCTHQTGFMRELLFFIHEIAEFDDKWHKHVEHVTGRFPL